MYAIRSYYAGGEGNVRRFWNRILSPVYTSPKHHRSNSMQTGLEFDNDVNTVRLVYSKGSSLEYVLHRELASPPA